MHLSSSARSQVSQWFAQSTAAGAHECVCTSKSVQGLPRALGNRAKQGQTGMIASPGLSRACTAAAVARLLQDLGSREATPAAPLPQHLWWALACSQILLGHNCLDQGWRSPSITWSAQLPCLAGSQSLPLPHRLQGRGWGGCARRGWAGKGVGGCRSPGVRAHVWVHRRRRRLQTQRNGPLMESRGLWMVQIRAGSCCNPSLWCHSPAVLSPWESFKGSSWFQGCIVKLGRDGVFWALFNQVLTSKRQLEKVPNKIPCLQWGQLLSLFKWNPALYMVSFFVSMTCTSVVGFCPTNPYSISVCWERSWART